MRLGPGLWSRFTNLFESDDFNLKHHVFSELAALPVDEFNHKMKEIMANTKEGKKIIKNIVDEVKNDLQEEEYQNSITEVKPEINSFTLEELLNGIDGDFNPDSNTDDEGFDIGELF
jgi:hypothetical protein